MPKSPKPFFRTARNAWYVQIGTKQTRLADGPKTADSERAAWTAFDALVKAQPIAHTVGALSLAVLIDKYLDWCQKHREPRTYDGYLWHLQRFIDHLGSKAHMPCTELKPFHVNEWVDAHEWGATYRRNAIAAVKRVYAWAEEEGYLDSNPIKRLKKPMANRREHLITPDDWQKIKEAYKADDPFLALLEFCWMTGARPHEAKRLDAKHYDRVNRQIAIPPREAKGRKRWRFIILEGRALELVEKHCKEGIIFRNREGKPWTTTAVNSRFCRLKDKLGVKHFQGSFRHSYATRLIINGVDPLTVSELLGHVDGSMLAKTYQQLAKAKEHLRQAAKKA